LAEAKKRKTKTEAKNICLASLKMPSAIAQQPRDFEPFCSVLSEVKVHEITQLQSLLEPLFN